jgi:hypothetical protein
MSQVDPVEVANGHHARARRLRKLPEIVDDPHVLRTEKRKSKSEKPEAARPREAAPR